MEGIILSPLKIIPGELGNVLHALKSNEPEFTSFGEAYFSTVKRGAVKGWKKHSRMVLNLVVPIGKIRFVIFDDRAQSATFKEYFSITLSAAENYQRLTVSPGLWMAFEGIAETNLLLNIASIQHDPTESQNIPLTSGLIKYPHG